MEPIFLVLTKLVSSRTIFTLHSSSNVPVLLMEIRPVLPWREQLGVQSTIKALYVQLKILVVVVAQPSIPLF